MSSQKDKDYHKLRNPDKYDLDGGINTYSGEQTKEEAERARRYQKLWSKYGNKSMVSDKRRRNSTRKSNQKDKQILHKIERAQNKQNLIKHLINENMPLETEVAHGSIWNI